MGDAFRRLFLSIGIGLGLVSGQPDPSLIARLAFEDGALAVNVRVESAFAPGARELVEAGTRVALRYLARLEPAEGEARSVQETRSLTYNLRTAHYDVAFDGGKTAALIDPQAARTLVSELSGFAICRASDAKEGDRIIVRAEIGIIDSHGDWHDAPVLWNYSSPRAMLTYGHRQEGSR